MRSFPLIALLGVLCVAPFQSPTPRAAVEVQPVRIVTKEQAKAEFIHRLAQVTFAPKDGECWDFSAKSVYEYTGFQPEPVKPAEPAKKLDDSKYGRGYKLPPPHVAAARHRISNAKYGNYLRSLPKATQVSYDAYAAPGGSCIPPIGDQDGCGDCYAWSGCKAASAAQMTAGVVPKGSGFMLSVQWTLDCHPNLGGCDGGQEYEVAQLIMSQGAPSNVEYAGAGQQPGRCKDLSGMKLYSIVSIIYVDPAQSEQGVASTQSIKNAILAHGYVSVAAAAGSDWDNAGPGRTITGRSNNVNHAIGATGWDDNHDNGDGTKGAFICENQWGTSWGDKGRAWIKYGADSFGTAAFICIAPPAPVPPTPPGPGPTPPVPPGPIPPTPGTAPSILLSNTGSPYDGREMELVNKGVSGRVAEATAFMIELNKELNPQPVTPPSPCGKENDKRWEAQDKTNKAMLDALIAIQKQLTPVKP